jgi:hypothetical protein
MRRKTDPAPDDSRNTPGDGMMPEPRATWGSVILVVRRRWLTAASVAGCPQAAGG